MERHKSPNIFPKGFKIRVSSIDLVFFTIVDKSDAVFHIRIQSLSLNFRIKDLNIMNLGMRFIIFLIS